jgi:hypothetical protein
VPPYPARSAFLVVLGFELRASCFARQLGLSLEPCFHLGVLLEVTVLVSVRVLPSFTGLHQSTAR